MQQDAATDNLPAVPPCRL